jgi:hypothetical protein
MEQHENPDSGAKEFAAAHPELADGAADYIAENPDGYLSGLVEKAKAHKAGKKYAGLFNCPASDGNFTSALHGLSVEELEAFKAELVTRDLDEHCHKGRINAVAKEIRLRSSGSPEIFAVERMAEDVVTADGLYGDGMVYDIDRMENEIRFWQDQAGTALLEIGKRLIRIKAHEGHGKFLESLDRLGMAPRSAQYAMLAARKFSNTNTCSHLKPSKIRALTVLDEDDIKILESGGAVRGMTLDDIDRMTNRELRENFRKEKQKLEEEKKARERERKVQEDAIAQKEAKINELDRELRYRLPPTKEQLAEIELQNLNKDFFEALMCLAGDIRKVLNILARAERIENVTYPLLREWINRYADSCEAINAGFTELQDAIKQPYIDRGEAEDE